MKIHSPQGREAPMPFPKSAAAARRWSAEGRWSSTSGTLSRNQAVAGPGSLKAPATNRISIASVPKNAIAPKGRRGASMWPCSGPGAGGG